MIEVFGGVCSILSKKIEKIFITNNKLLQYRVTAVLVAFFYVIFAFVFKLNNIKDPMGIHRYIAISVLVIGFILSFLSAKVKSHINKIMFFSIYFLNLQMIFLGYYHSFTSFHILAIMSMMFFVDLIFDDVILIGFYNINTAVLTTILILVNKHTTSDFQLVLVILAASLLPYLISFSKLNAQKKIRYLTYHDSLTDLYNRNYLNEEISNIDTEENLPLSIILGDLNGLKIVNDAFGHQKGDKILSAAAEVFKKSCREKDIPIRWGGDEFLVYLPQTTYEKTRKIAAKINKKFDEVKVGPIKPTIALGYETKNKTDEDLTDIFKQAEEHMYTKKLEESRNAHSTIISSLRKTLSESTNETSKHCQRMREYVIELGEAIELSDHQLIEIGLLAELHDLGKIAVTKDILQKEDKLDENEWVQIKRHCEIGYKVASSSPEIIKIAEGILSHHEWWDGTGYPQNLKGDDIPLSARIISIVDAFDVMTHGRCYKPAVSVDKAVQELIACKGSQFDPELVDIFINKVLKHRKKT
ncbi:MAG: HD domain-containing phosphohydrolase [Halothermotrichaceae bacterium]